VSPLEERIGYKFRNSLLLAEALTHPSLGHETQRYHFDNQRLEFLGDAILQLVITEYLYGHFRSEAEGQLTKLRSRLVSREALRGHALALDLDSDLATAKKFILAQARADLDQLAEAPIDINPKGQLQELLQSISPRSPVYELISQSGPEHEKTFVVQAVWEDVVLGQGSGRSKKQAETAAALEAMELKRWKKQNGADKFL